QYFGQVQKTASGYVASIYRNLNGVWSALAAPTPVNVSGFTGTGTLRFEAVGPSLKLFLNGTMVAFASDGALTTGTVGMGTTAGASLTAFSAGALTPTTPTLPFSDTFGSPANQQLSSDWLNQTGSFQVVSGVAKGVAAANYATVNGIKTSKATVSATVDVTGG